MEQEEKNIELIESYLAGTLSERERADFEKRCAENKDFAAEVEDYSLIMKEINSSQAHVFTQKLKTWEDEIAERETRVIPLRRILSIAATFLIVVLAGGYMASQYFNSQNSEELFTAYFKPYQDVISQRSNDADPLQQGMDLYNQGDYANAIPHLKSFLDSHPAQRDVKCYLGISLLASDQTIEAKKVFEELVPHEPDLFTEIAEWNLALAHLKLDEKDLLKRSLEGIIAQPDHLYKTQAESLYSKYY